MLTGGSGPLTGSHPLGSASCAQLLHNAALPLPLGQSRAKRVWWPRCRPPARPKGNGSLCKVSALGSAACACASRSGPLPRPALRLRPRRVARMALLFQSVRFAQFVSQRPSAVSWLLAPRPPAPRSLRSHRPRPGPSAPPEGGSLQGAGVSSISGLSGSRVSCPPRPAVAAGKNSVSGASPRPQLPLRLALARFLSSLLQARRGAPGACSSVAFPQTCPLTRRTTVFVVLDLY